jgi:hypothetical protein
VDRGFLELSGQGNLTSHWQTDGGRPMTDSQDSSFTPFRLDCAPPGIARKCPSVHAGECPSNDHFIQPAGASDPINKVYS